MPYPATLSGVADMSIAAGFRYKWSVIMGASDDSRGQNVDARYAAMAKAAEAAGLMLIDRSVFRTLCDKIEELRPKP